MRERSYGDGGLASAPSGTIKVAEHHSGDPVFEVTPLLSFQNLKVPLLESFEKNNALTRPSARFLAFFKSPDSSTSTSEAPSDRWTFLPGSLILHDISGS